MADDGDAMQRLDAYRLSEAGPLENDLIDVLADEGIDRQEFIKRATVLGLSIGVIGAALGARGTPVAYGAPVASKAGGRVRFGVPYLPTQDLEPHALTGGGGILATYVCGEFLVRTTNTLTLKPELALSWKPNANANVWTFKLRPGVKFQSGQAFGADDVVATFNRLVDPNSGSGALSAFQGVLSPGGIKAIDNLTVQFTLDAPTASFPYLTSSATYQAIMLPKDYKLGTFVTTPQTTGAFAITGYTLGVSAKYDRNPGWWGGKAPLDGVDLVFYSEEAAMVAALLSGELELVANLTQSGVRTVKTPQLQLFTARGARHTEVPMRVDMANPLKDRRVREAIALTLDRPGIVKTLFNNLADVGNDSPFAPVYPSTSKKVPQRVRNLAMAKKLMAQAGYPRGFKVTLTAWGTNEIPQLAQIIQRSVKAIGIDISLQLQTGTVYFGGSQSGPPKGWGSTPWLNAPLTVTGWNARPVPNVLLTSSIKSRGVWNASHYSNPKLDRVIDRYLSSITVSDQQKYSAQIQRAMLHDTPVIFPYFNRTIQAGSTKLRGYESDPQEFVYLSRTSLA
jgi:peptide/nickel transport system substrate-binding protein